MTADLITEEKKKLKAEIIKALKEFSKQTALRVEEIKIFTNEIRSDAGTDYFYNDLVFKITL